MMQATDFWNLDDHAQARWLGWPSVGCVLVEREMSSWLRSFNKVITVLDAFAAAVRAQDVVDVGVELLEEARGTL